jgi:MtrB/PioB family decaheme-associated outer membrane protein
MKTNTSLGFRLAPITAAVLVAFVGPVHAAEGDLRSMITPDSSVDVGAGYVDQDNGNFGKYNGLNEEGGYLLLDGDVKTRDDLSGSWTRLRFRNLGLDSREIRWDQNRQGNWGYYLEYNEIPRFEPLQVITPVVGIGSASLSLGSTPVLVDIESKRKRYSLGFDKAFASKWGFNVDFRNETKKGERIFGHGTPSGGGTFNFTPEPFDSTIRLLDATARYTDTKFQLVGGLYGTQYRNDNSSLTWSYDGTSLSPSALPPDNQSYQLYVTGGYSFNPTTRGTFKAAYTKATQDDNFIEPTLSGRTDLGGKVETTLLQAGIAARPMPKLSILGNLRYEDRDDKTPVTRYVVTAGSWLGYNEPRSITYTDAKLEASYALPQGFRVIGGVEYDQKERSSVDPRSVSHRDKTEEWSYRAELRRAMSETLTGGLSYTYSERDGSDFLPDVDSTGTPELLYIKPYHQTDRKRDKVRLSLNWMPVEPLSVQFYLEDISDRFDAGFTDPTNAALNPVGAIKGEQKVYAIDAAYQFNKMWQASAWYNYNEYKFQNRTLEYSGESKNKGNAFGVGVRGKPNSRIEVGADYSYNDIEDEWNQQLDAALLPLPAGEALPPNATTRLTRLKLFGKYNLDRNSGLRLDYIFDRFSSDDPTWTGWVPGTPGGSYAEGTVVSQPSPQTTHFVGVRYFYNF